MLAGWYPDESGLPFERYWDGARWTADVRPLTSSASPFVVARPQPWYQRRGIVIAGAILSALLVISAIAGALAPKKSNTTSANDAAAAGETYSSAVPKPPPQHTRAKPIQHRAHRPASTTVQLLASSSSVRAGRTVTISGSVVPRRAGQVVYLQRRSAYGWISVAHQRLNKHSRFHFLLPESRAGAFAYRVREPQVPHRFRSDVSSVVRVRVHAVVHRVAPIAAPPARSCTPGYNPCVPVASDVDCAGGSGNGPAYVQGPIYVTGSDPYGLDADGDGVACES
jgi:hypothetical protein